MAERITWDQYFMGLALLSAQRSKDSNVPRTVPVSSTHHNRIVGIGYNWFPRGCPDDEFPHARGRDEQGNLLRLYDSKHAYVVHAEANAILNSMGRDMQGATLYCAMPTCNECAKLIVQVGIKRVVYLASPTYEARDEFLAAKRMYASAGVLCELYNGPTNSLELNFDDAHGKSEKKGT
jgi:dCMP deaminase